MDKQADESKGRIKEATGALTGDDDLKREGKVDQGTASAKDAVDKVSDKAKDLLRGDKR